MNAVAPGPIETEKTTPGFRKRDAGHEVSPSPAPLRRIGVPADIANAVLYLASDEANYITGTTLAVAGGRSTMDTSTDIANALDHDIAALKARAADFDARHQLIEKITWPQGVRIAVNFTADLTRCCCAACSTSRRWQLAEARVRRSCRHLAADRAVRQPHIKATIFTPGRICELYPRGVKAASESGHEIADHTWEHQVPKDAELERDHLRKAKDAIEKLTGKRPMGTRSWHTRELLLEEGFIYNSHDTLDHLPHYVSAPDGSKPLLNLPFHYAIDDAMFFSFAWLNTENQAQRHDGPDHVEEIRWAAFLQQYQQGGYRNICMHPFVSGRALRIAMLDRLIGRMKALPGVWFPTCEQVARHVLATHPAR